MPPRLNPNRTDCVTLQRSVISIVNCLVRDSSSFVTSPRVIVNHTPSSRVIIVFDNCLHYLHKQYTLYERLGTRLARACRNLELRAGAKFKNLVPQQEKGNLGFDTRRRLCGDRDEGECVGVQEAAGGRVSNQSKHHWSRFHREHQSAD